MYMSWAYLANVVRFCSKVHGSDRAGCTYLSILSPSLVEQQQQPYITQSVQSVLQQFCLFVHYRSV